MPYGLIKGEEHSQLCNRLLMQYQYKGKESATLRLRPVIGDRNFHHQQSEHEDLQFSQLVTPNQIYLQSIRTGLVGTPWQLRRRAGNYQPAGTWSSNYFDHQQNRRG